MASAEASVEALAAQVEEHEEANEAVTGNNLDDNAVDDKGGVCKPDCESAAEGRGVVELGTGRVCSGG